MRRRSVLNSDLGAINVFWTLRTLQLSSSHKKINMIYLSLDVLAFENYNPDVTTRESHEVYNHIPTTVSILGQNNAFENI